MIEDPPLLQVRRGFARPTREQIEALRGLQTGFVVDAMNGRGGWDGRIKPITTPNSPARNGPGTVGLPIVVGGVAVSAGDIVLGDEDGVVIVPAARIEETIARLPAVRAAEADLDAKVKAGLGIPAFIQQFIDSGRFTEVS